jgi:hypothetical protein
LRFRLVGTEIVRAYGAELTGRHFDEFLSAGRLATALRHFAMAAENGRPVMVRAAYKNSAGEDIVAARVIAPLSEDGERVNMFVVVQEFSYGSRLPTAIDERAAPNPEGTVATVLADA